MPEPHTPFSGYRANTLYEFTIAPDDAHQFLRPNKVIGSAHARLDAFTTYYRSLFTKYKPYIEVDLMVEVSEVNIGQNMPRLHLHGTLELKQTSSILPFLLNILPTIQQHARVSINDYRPEHWPDYINKQQYIFTTEYAKYRKISNKNQKANFKDYGIQIPDSDSEDEDPLRVPYVIP